VRQRLPELAELGVTAIELMPLASFAGPRGWGYDGVLLYAPHAAYGQPGDLRELIDVAHANGIMIMLDVVYNHFGPDGNFLPVYCPSFFREDVHTPWGAAIDYRQPEVRAFAIENALYWLEEFGFDGLRLDAVHAIVGDAESHLLDELAARVRDHLGGEQHIHLVLENEHNEARRLGTAIASQGAANPSSAKYDAQWNDDWHHCAHVLATGENEAYYKAFAEHTLERLAKAEASGFVFQGEPSSTHDGKRRGEPSAQLPPTCFVNFLQNHDQIGNRAVGERLSVLAAPRALEVFTSLLLLSPQIPMLFMGEEWGTERPFLFFTDFEGELAPWSVVWFLEPVEAS
jgi:malto-oligosyltrehalose trehalohydrolase